MEIQVRDLTVKDIFTVARILGKVAKGSRSQLVLLLNNRSQTVAPAELGLSLIQTLCLDAEDDVKAWLADLIGTDVKGFEAMPPVVLFDIVEQIARKEDFKGFLSRASGLATRLVPPESGKPGTPSSTGTAGETQTSTG